MTCGIYKLVFLGTDKVYVGRSKHIEIRLVEHKYNMFKGTSSKKLNEAYKVYSFPSIEILQECDESMLEETEQIYLTLLNPVELGFNTSRSSLGGNAQCGEDSAISVYTNDEIVKVFKLLVKDISLSLQKISDITGVSKGTVGQVSRGGRHRVWLEALFPIEYEYLMSIKGTKKQFIQNAKTQGIIYPNVVSPKGVIYEVTSCIGFAREHGLDQGCFNRLLNNKAKSHRGWRQA